MNILNPCGVHENIGLYIVSGTTADGRVSNYVWASTPLRARRTFESAYDVSHVGTPSIPPTQADVRDAERRSRNICPKSFMRTAEVTKTDKQKQMDFFFPRSSMPKPRPGGGGFLGIRPSRNPFRS